MQQWPMKMLIESNWNERRRLPVRREMAAYKRVMLNYQEDSMVRDPKAAVSTQALLNLVRLLAAELVAGVHRHDVDKLIQAIDRKLDATPLPGGTPVEDARMGIADARKMLGPHLKRLRVQARIARSQAHRPAPSLGRHLH
jgi:hypothetical protein